MTDNILEKYIIILGSSRSDGHTKAVIQAFDPDCQIDRVDLNDLRITPFDYTHQNKNDDYIPLMEKIIAFDHIILATPVYWYTMSAQMKIFIDRLSDLLTIRKDLRKKLAGKKVSVLASYGNALPNGFELAFSQTCTYMKMDYCGCFFYYSGTDEKRTAKNDAIHDFKKNLLHEH
jgi:multimeric flavodoxin WrbA